MHRGGWAHGFSPGLQQDSVLSDALKESLLTVTSCYVERVVQLRPEAAQGMLPGSRESPSQQGGPELGEEQRAMIAR